MRQNICSRNWTRREWLAAAAGAAAAGPARAAREAPTAPVAIVRCDSYGPELEPSLRRIFDQIGGLSRLVSGKTVVMKVNMTGAPETRLGSVPAEDSYWTHPQVVAATAHLMTLAGARRVRVVESFAAQAEPLEEYMIRAGWEPRDILNAGPGIEMENTGFLGYGKKYHRLTVPWGGYVYPAFDLNHSYEECDVFVSISKLKEHITAGVTMSMKNLFGIAPPTIYGQAAGKDEPAKIPNGGRSMFHTGYRQPSRSAPQEIAHQVPKDPGARVPRIVVDLVGARPIHLSIVDAIVTMNTGEGPWTEGFKGRKIRVVKPGILLAGLNPVTTDAVSTALMGFDPMADRGTAPFEDCDSTLRLAEDAGIGTRDLGRIEVIGVRIREAAIPFRQLT
jgi:uncharacterized protein (DUF362 family)